MEIVKCPKCGSGDVEQDKNGTFSCQWCGEIFGACVAIPRPCIRDEYGEISKQHLASCLFKIEEEKRELEDEIFKHVPVYTEMQHVMENYDAEIRRKALERIADEWADLVTAATTTVHHLGITEDMRAAAIVRVNKRNEERGRL